MAKTKTPVVRDKAGRFVKGFSGNPNGMPGMPEDIKAAFREVSPQALKVLTDIINDEKAKDADRIKAAEVILDRGYGKPRQQVDLDAKSIPQVVFINGDNIAD